MQVKVCNGKTCDSLSRNLFCLLLSHEITYAILSIDINQACVSAI